MDYLQKVLDENIIKLGNQKEIHLKDMLVNINNDANIFDILITALKKIELGLDPFVILLIVELKYLNYLGLSISLDCCSNCGNSNNIVTLSSGQQPDVTKVL